MPELAIVLDSLDDAPEALKDHYTKGNAEHGEDAALFYLRAKGRDGFAVENVRRLKEANHDLREKVGANKRALASFTELGDLDDIKARLERLTELEARKNGKQGSDDEGEDAANLKKLLEKVTGERDAALAARDTHLGRLDDMLKRRAIREALSEAKFNRHLDLLEERILPRVAVVRGDDGAEAVYVCDPVTGKPRLTETPNSDAFMGVSELTKAMATDEAYQDLIEGSRTSGVDVRTGRTGDRGRQNQSTDSDMKPIERLRQAFAATEG